MSKLVALHALVVTVIACGPKSTPTTAPPPPPPAADAGVVDQGPASTAPEGASREKPRAILPDQRTWKPLGVGTAEIAIVEGDPESEPTSYFLKLPGGPGTLLTKTSEEHGVVVSGVLTNSQDGAAKPTTLTAQSYWYQPGGVVHAPFCTSDALCIAFVQSLGRLAVTPATAAKGAKPDPRYVEKRIKTATWSPIDAKLPALGSMAPLWGDASSQPNGMFVKIPAGNQTVWHIHKSDFQAVVLAGTVTHTQSGQDPLTLPVGAWVWQPGGYKHAETCNAGGADCILYVSHAGGFMVKPAD